MSSDRSIATTTGVLFILTEITAITGLVLYDPILTDPHYIIKGAGEMRILAGALSEILLVFSVVGTSITLFPILRKSNETLAIGTICFRLLEATIITIGIISLLTIVTLNHEFMKDTNPVESSYLMAGRLLLDIHNWTFLYGPNLMLGPSTFLTSYLLHRSRLVPRIITYSGIIGGPLISLNAVLVTFGCYSQTSSWGFILAIPVFTYEVSLAVRLLSKGFNSLPRTYEPVQNLFQLARKA